MLSIKFTTHKVKFLNSTHEDLTHYTSKCFISEGPVLKTHGVLKIHCIFSIKGITKTNSDFFFV